MNPGEESTSACPLGRPVGHPAPPHTPGGRLLPPCTVHYLDHDVFMRVAVVHMMTGCAFLGDPAHTYEREANAYRAAEKIYHQPDGSLIVRTWLEGDPEWEINVPAGQWERSAPPSWLAEYLEE